MLLRNSLIFSGDPDLLQATLDLFGDRGWHFALHFADCPLIGFFLERKIRWESELRCLGEFLLLEPDFRFSDFSDPALGLCAERFS